MQSMIVSLFIFLHVRMIVELSDLDAKRPKSCYLDCNEQNVTYETYLLYRHWTAFHIE